MSVFKKHKGKRITAKHPAYHKAHWWCYKRVRGHKTIHQSLPLVTTKEQAEKAERALIEQIFNSHYGIADTSTTFSDFVDKVYVNYVEQKNENVYVKMIFIKILKEHFGSKAISSLTAQDCRDFQWKRQRTPTKKGTPRANASVNKEMSTLSKILTLAVEEKVIKEHPMRYVTKLKEAPPRRYVLTDEQKERLWQNLEKDQLMLRLVTIAVNLPLRRGQLLAITPDAIDLQKGLLLAGKSKGRESRVVPLNSTALNMLRLMLAENQLPFPLRVFQKRWKKILVAAKINKEDGTREENYHFHDLRVWFGSELLKRGVNAYHIKELFNHSSMEISSIYIKSEQSQLADAVKRLDVIETEGVQ